MVDFSEKGARSESGRSKGEYRGFGRLVLKSGHDSRISEAEL
jgi:hypothetical protein